VRLLIFLFLVGCSQAPVPLTPPQTLDDLVTQLKAQPSGTQVKLLFVISAKKGIVHRVDEKGTHMFVFNKKDLTAAIAFTDRPERHAFDMSLSMFVSIWTEGKDSFADDPPNAVLIDDNAKIGITVLTGLTENPDTVIFSLNRNAYKAIDVADKLTTHLVNPTLVIDSLITAGGVALLLQQGAKACAAVECWWALAG
jgi:hypothetical protein